ncbi:sensor domain-containing diguanylate cyclase [Pseudomonas putida]|uniref:Sensor domain-containing diguanylate cyclase n=1 Tax=Pseudomonas putida TaxID=303 RepID=A0A4D6X3B4_PSEPU|nr:sensor domain-containing diguanylate cyclase [Pseudomonas putida]QCI10156.1 sensor domain-containing diguanylate cyclase [Pseudomonas putida]
MLAARSPVEIRSVHMANDTDFPSPGNPAPEAAQTLLALLHAEGEVARLSEREQLYSALLDSVNAVLWAFDWETRQVLYVSPAYERIFGKPVSLVLADYNEWRDSIYPDDLEFAERSLAQVLHKGAVEDREYRILNASGQVRWLSDKCYINQQQGERVIIVGIAEDITEKKQLEGELQRLATTDVLTQSSNRRHFFECARQAFEEARDNGTPLAFLLLDIDDFKRINDSFGHQEGDQVLQRIADSGKATLRRGDLFGRVGGEEFAAVFPGCTAQVAEQIAQRLQREIQRLSFSHGEHTYGVTVSQGLTGLTEQDETLDTLFARADAAMYRAKRQGKNQIVRA